MYYYYLFICVNPLQLRSHQKFHFCRNSSAELPYISVNLLQLRCGQIFCYCTNNSAELQMKRFISVYQPQLRFSQINFDCKFASAETVSNILLLSTHFSWNAVKYFATVDSFQLRSIQIFCYCTINSAELEVKNSTSVDTFQLRFGQIFYYCWYSSADNSVKYFSTVDTVQLRYPVPV